MKHAVRVDLESIVVEAGGEARETRHTYEGTWYRQRAGDYLVYVDEGIHTTLRWDDREVRLYRRGDRLEAYQVFRTGQALEFELAAGGTRLALTTTTHDISADTGDAGGTLVLKYSLCSGHADLGEFTLTIRIAVLPERA